MKLMKLKNVYNKKCCFYKIKFDLLITYAYIYIYTIYCLFV